jgi:hypothetical protein
LKTYVLCSAANAPVKSSAAAPPSAAAALAALPPAVRDAVEVVWDFLQVKHEPARADAILSLVAANAQAAAYYRNLTAQAAAHLPLPPVPPSTDVVEAARCIDELGAPEWHLHIVKRGVTLAMDRGGREREMIAVLLAALPAGIVHMCTHARAARVAGAQHGPRPIGVAA